jgi:hypothetical protein
MMPKPIRSTLVFAVALFTAGCVVNNQQLRTYHVDEKSVELTDVPFLPQETDQGGPAALATILWSTDLTISPSDLTEDVYNPESGSSPPQAMVFTTRRSGRIPYILDSNTIDLDMVKELQSGHPVMVLLRSTYFFFWHEWYYAVVVGVDPDSSQFVMRMGLKKRVVMSYGDLLAAWRPGHYWAMAVAKPDPRPASIPVSAEPAKWVAAAEPFVALGKPDIAIKADTAATKRWPDLVLTWAALGKASYLSGDLPGATVAYAGAIKVDPGNAEMHALLAQVLFDRQCSEQAEDEIKKALPLEADPAKRAAYEQTSTQYGLLGGPSVVCQLN